MKKETEISISEQFSNNKPLKTINLESLDDDKASINIFSED